jgi:hypothetical protein
VLGVSLHCTACLFIGMPSPGSRVASFECQLNTCKALRSIMHPVQPLEKCHTAEDNIGDACTAGGLPPMPSLALLAQRLPQSGAPLTADPLAGSLLYGTLKNLRRVVARMAAADVQRALLAEGQQAQFPGVLPGLCMAYCSPIADVRKATVECLVSMWLVSGPASARGEQCF